MARLCERPTCGAVATFAYGFDVERRIVWLDALGDERFRAGALCRRHADRLTVPRGWWLEDRRTPDSLFEVDEAPEATPTAPPEPAPAPKSRSRRKKAAPSEPPPDGMAEPGPPAAAESPATGETAAPTEVAGAVAPAPVPPGPAGAETAGPAETEASNPEDAESAGPVDTEASKPEDAESGGPVEPDPFPDPTVVDVAEPWEDPEAGEPDHQWEPAFASVDPDPAVDAASTPLLAKAFGHDAPQPGPRRRPRRPRPAPDTGSSDQGDPSGPGPVG